MIEWFEKRLHEVKNVLLDQGKTFIFRLEEPATKEQIFECEKTIGLLLPPSFKDFLKCCNGCALGVDVEEGLSLEIYISSISRIVKKDKDFRESFRDCTRDGEVVISDNLEDEAGKFWSSLIVCAKYGVGYCVFDSQQVKNGEYAVLDMDQDDIRGTREHVIASSFEEWMLKMLDSVENGGKLLYWPLL